MLFARGPVIKSGPPLGEPPIPPPSSISSGSENLPSSVQQGHFLHTPKPSPPTILPDTIQVTETTTPTRPLPESSGQPRTCCETSLRAWHREREEGPNQTGPPPESTAKSNSPSPLFLFPPSLHAASCILSPWHHLLADPRYTEHLSGRASTVQPSHLWFQPVQLRR